MPASLRMFGWAWCRRLTLVFAFVLVVLIAGSWKVGTDATAPANQSSGEAPYQLAAEEVFFDSQSGSTLAAWYSPQVSASATIILLHPLRGNRQSMVSRALLLKEHGYSTLLIDLQAHGESLGENQTFGHLERLDVEAAVKFVREKAPADKIGIIGWSLGGAAALLADVDVDAMVLESVYPTFRSAVHNRVQMRLGVLHYALAPLLWIQLKPRLGISTQDLCPVEHVASVQCPILIAAGDEDQRCTIQESRRLFEEVTAQKDFLVFRGAQHEDLFRFDEPRYRSRIVEFLQNSLDD